VYVAVVVADGQIELMPVILPPLLNWGAPVYTDIVILLLVVGLPVAQVALEVKTQVTICPLVKPAEVYVALLAPTVLPFTFH
jgi:hypothetical protein